LWQRRFGGRPDVLGKSVLLNGVASTIIGVAPLRFRYPDDRVELWAPIADQMDGLPRARRFFLAIARIPSAVRPSFSRVISASGSFGFSQTSLDIFFLRLRSHGLLA
jgi:hypothetical protein